MIQKRNLIFVFGLAFIFATIFCIYARNLSVESKAVSRTFHTGIGTVESFSDCNEEDCKQKIDPDFNTMPNDGRNFKPGIGGRRPPEFIIPPNPDSSYSK